MKKIPPTKAYLTIATTSPPQTIGTLPLTLHSQTTPRTVTNFLHLLTLPPTQKGYLNTPFHRLIPNFMIQGGDTTAQNGTGGKSLLYDDHHDGSGSFIDENFRLGHGKRGVLSMANSGKDTNGSQFFITFRECRHLDGKHVVFGCVDLEGEGGVEGRRVLGWLEGVGVGKGDVPDVEIVIAGGGVVGGGGLGEEKAGDGIKSPEVKDEDEIDLDDDGDDDDDEDDGEVEDNGEETDKETDKTDKTKPPQPTTTTKRSKLQERLRKLKLKMNQSKRLNHTEVLNEGERLGSEENILRHTKRLSKEEKERIHKEFTTVNAKALNNAGGGDGTTSSSSASSSKKKSLSMVQQASESLRLRHKAEDKAERNRFEVNDYYNPEGQLRNYERSLRSLGGMGGGGKGGGGRHYYNSVGDDDKDTSIGVGGDGEEEGMDGRRITLNNERREQKQLNRYQQNEREGSRRMARELSRRNEKAEKRKRDRKDVEFEGTDIGHINDRNARFNKKINRNYDRHTAEIRQNLERGTAL